MRKLLSAVVVVVVLVCSSNAAVYNLAADWSDTLNPNGVWSLYKNANSLFTINQPDFSNNGTYQKAWADQPCFLNAHVPVWLKSNVDGVVYAHGAEFDRTGSTVTFARWTSPQDGTVAISGAIWTITYYARSMGWNLRYEGANITGGSLYSDGSQGAGNPVLFSQGSAGASVLTFDIQAGQTIDLVLTSLSESGNLGDSLGLDFTITIIPEPTTLLLLGLGTFIFVGKRS